MLWLPKPGQADRSFEGWPYIPTVDTTPHFFEKMIGNLSGMALLEVISGADIYARRNEPDATWGEPVSTHEESMDMHQESNRHGDIVSPADRAPESTLGNMAIGLAAPPVESAQDMEMASEHIVTGAPIIPEYAAMGYSAVDVEHGTDGYGMEGLDGDAGQGGDGGAGDAGGEA
jgi:hypothetical protein